MDTQDFSPLTVAPFSKDFVVDLVRSKTNWAHRNEVFEKRQLNYLCRYLSINHIDAKTVVVEDQYVDKHYLEDYAEYYARCFQPHPRFCSRLHFFSNEFVESDFITGLVRGGEFIESLVKNYIGFAVVRPLPNTILAKVCIKPYQALVDREEYKVITKLHPVSLFGVDLEVDSTAFLEQDKVVSACATSALWSLLSASHHIPEQYLPSPSGITKAAVSDSSDGGRVFPSEGLTPIQVERCLKHFGLEPTTVVTAGDPPSRLNALKEIIYCYVSNNVPVLIGGDVYQESERLTGRFEYLGKHFVCATGYRLDAAPSTNLFQLSSHGLGRIYIHDDRNGPFSRLIPNEVDFQSENGERVSGLELGFDAETPNRFVPHIAILGLNHKVRLSYRYIEDACKAFYSYLGLTESYLRDASKDADANVCNRALGANWDITLTSNNQLKAEVRTCGRFLTYSGSAELSSFLLANLPRHIFRVRLFANSDRQELLTEILFDATEVPQGQVIVGYLSYSEDAERLWKLVEKTVRKSNLWDTKLDRSANANISSFLKFLGSDDLGSTLNTLYGMKKTPSRAVKRGEVDQFRNYEKRTDVFTVRRRSDDTAWGSLLKESKRYIWVINEYGDLVIGEDVADETDGFKGHPTLIDGGPARLGGELVYDREKSEWLANLKSRSYSYHLVATSLDTRKTYLENVIRENLKGLDVRLDLEEA